MTINVYTEQTPNPATMKFMVNKLLINGSEDFATKESAEHSPFAKELYKFNFVSGVFFASNFVTITKTEDAEWADIEAILKEFVKGAVESELKIKDATTEEALALKVLKPKLKFSKFYMTTFALRLSRMVAQLATNLSMKV